MAEGALSDLAGNVLELLLSLIVEEVKLAISVKTEIKNLAETVSIIQSLIPVAEKQSPHSHQIKDWLRKLQVVLLDADDLLDDFSFEVLRQKVKTKELCIFSFSSNPLAYNLKMGCKIKEIRERLSALAKDKEEHFRFSQSFVEPRAELENDYDVVFGRDNDKEQIMRRLFDYDVIENISIIPIVGIGGLGKTTLAQLVYYDEKVKRNFELKLWIRISDIFDVKRIVKEILEQLIDWMHEESLEILQNRLREKLNGKKYLIILDDMWNEDIEKWLLLKNLLMGGSRGSRIIVTTRSERVARITGTTSCYALMGLSKENAWSLFVKMAFERGRLRENQAFLRLGKEIVEKCDGVPLAIRTIASLLRTKASENEWLSLAHYELPKIHLEKENKILSTLKLSYDHLPSYLKQCFAYCRLFPKGYKIDVKTLIHLWAAQGFINLSNPKQRVEDIGRSYLMELLQRSFFQDVEKDEYGNIEYCKMHDQMHDLTILVARSESTMLNLSEEYMGEEFRHVSLVDSSRQLQVSIIKGMKVRTILAASIGGELGNLTCDALISNLNYLRTLDLSNLGLHVVPGSIGKLKHLRYLDLSENNVKILPNSITKLVYLQTLLLKYCSSLIELPKGIKKLVNLRFLDITYCDQLIDMGNFRGYLEGSQLTSMPLEIRHHTYLETILPWVVVTTESSRGQVKKGYCGSYKEKKAKSNGPSQLKELHNLGGFLRIENLGHGKDEVRECKDANLRDKQHLQHLVLKWDDSEWDAESECYDEMLLEGLQPHPNLKALGLRNYMGVRIPSWVSSLTNLVHFELLFNNRLQHLPPLNQLPFLKEVYLQFMEALEYIWIDEESVSNVLGASSSSSSSKTPFFPSLSSLCIGFCPKLKGWWRNSDDNEPHHLLLPSFPPSLSKLEIWDCPNLTSMPPFPYFKEPLILHGCSWKVLEQTMKMKMGAATTSTYFPPLSQLRELNLSQMVDFESLPEEWLRNLVSLRQLEIYFCDGLVSLPWIGSLTSLQTLYIFGCNNLSSLPQDIRNLTSLNVLSIYDCPLLGQRCKRQIGEDWPFIAHVSFIRVDGQKQQEETISSESESDSVC